MTTSSRYSLDLHCVACYLSFSCYVNCKICMIYCHASSRQRQRQPAGKLVPLPLLDEACQYIPADRVTHLPLTTSVYSSIWVVVDRLTKLAHFASFHAESVAEAAAYAATNAMMRSGLSCQHSQMSRSV